jgi:hypothetical protein
MLPNPGHPSSSIGSTYRAQPFVSHLSFAFASAVVLPLACGGPDAVSNLQSQTSGRRMASADLVQTNGLGVPLDQSLPDYEI